MDDRCALQWIIVCRHDQQLSRHLRSKVGPIQRHCAVFRNRLGSNTWLVLTSSIEWVAVGLFCAMGRRLVNSK